MDEQLAILRRIFVRAGERLGSPEALAAHLGVTDKELRAILVGAARPSEGVILRAVELIIDELPAIRADFSDKAWRTLPRQARRR